MDNKISYTQARQNLKATLDDVANNKTVTTISRRHGDDVVVLAADQYSAMAETLYLLSNPNNAKHLKDSIKDVKLGNVVAIDLDNL
ncbi:MAG: type II toxin-antitoxin system prevent-host-death family antitoxin [bacterium]